MKLRSLLLVSIAYLLSTSSSAQLVIDNTMTVEQYVSQVLLGSGVTATNITFNGAPANTVSIQVGSFNSANSNIGLPSGLIMAAGDVVTAIGPNDAGGSGSSSLGTYSDDDLNQLTAFTLNDEAVIEFDFVPSGDTIQFRYVFASEEYPEYACSTFNDVFGFFISGPGFNGPFANNGENLALIPGTTTYVAINTVTPGVAGTNGVASNCEDIDPNWESYNVYYTSNTTNTGGNEVQYDGFTVPITALARVQCGETYHIKFAVADATDTAFDSGVFLESNSFSSNSFNISGSIQTDTPPINVPQNTIIEGCYDGFFSIFQPNESIADTIVFQIGGAAIEGVDYAFLPDTVFIPVGQETVSVSLDVLEDAFAESTENITISFSYLNDCGDVITTSAELFIQDYVEPTLSVEDVCIPGTGSITVTPTAENGVQAFAYNWTGPVNSTESTLSLQDGQGGDYNLEITDLCGTTLQAQFTALESDPFILTANIEDPLNIAPNGAVIEGCMDANFVISQSNTTTADNVNFTVSGSATSGTDYQSLGSSITIPIGSTEVEIPIVVNADNATEGTEVLTITYDYVDGCGIAQTTSASVNIIDYVSLVGSVSPTVFICPNTTELVVPTITNGVSPYTYDWSTGETTSNVTFEFADAGEQDVVITDVCGESITLDFVIDVPSPLNTVIPFDLCVGTFSEVLVSGGTLPYTINFDATLLALNPDYSITAMMPGTTNFTVVDACNQTVQTSILSYVCNTVIPDIFTPNGDDLNETFTITGVEFFPGSSVLIFDRWGGLVHESADYKNDWNGGDAPDGVYYYIFNRSDGESFAGYVHLAR